jgi:hypothetical protein
MGKSQPNHRLLKIHRNYTVGEVAHILGNHKNSVRSWIKAGLPTIDNKRPTLILGHELIAFLQGRRARRKTPCAVGEMYCVRCRSPKSPAACMADYVPVNEGIGNLTAICPDCNCLMHRCVSKAKLGEFLGKMDITFPQALRHISEINQPTVNSDLR